MPTIKELRHSGKLEEALKLAKEALELDIDNIWNIRNIAWVYYDYLKKYIDEKSFDNIKDILIQIKDLDLPEDESVFFESCAWQIGNCLKFLYEDKDLNYSKISQIFKIVRDFHFVKPSKSYSFMYKEFHRGYEKWEKYIDFADWWGFENFEEEDYQTQNYNGRKIQPLVEQAYTAYSKKLLEGEYLDFDGIVFQDSEKVINKDKIKEFLPKLDEIIAKYPDYKYTAYYKAKLQLEIGSSTKEIVSSSFKSFVRKNITSYWVWDLLASIYREDKDLSFSCYCKALSIKTKEDYLIKLKQSFTKILIEKELYDEAKTEIIGINNIRIRNGWKIPYDISSWMSQSWFEIATEKCNNKDLYEKYSPIAESIIFDDVQEHTIVVVSINTNNRILNFIENKETSGYFKYKNFIENPKIGDILKVRFDGSGQDNYYKVSSIKKLSPDTPTDMIKYFSGTLKIIPNKSFGFVDDIFIDSKIIEKYKLKAGNTIKGRAIISFNKKNNTWGWKAIAIQTT